MNLEWMTRGLSTRQEDHCRGLRGRKHAKEVELNALIALSVPPCDLLASAGKLPGKICSTLEEEDLGGVD